MIPRIILHHRREQEHPGCPQCIHADEPPTGPHCHPCQCVRDENNRIRFFTNFKQKLPLPGTKYNLFD